MKTVTKRTAGTIPAYFLGRPAATYAERYARKATVHRLFEAGTEIQTTRQIAA